MLKIVDFKGSTSLFGLSKKTEIPFCTFWPKVNFWGYVKITYVLNSSSNLPTLSCHHPKIWQNRPFQQSQECQNQNQNHFHWNVIIGIRVFWFKFSSYNHLYYDEFHCKHPLRNKYFDWLSSITYQHLIGPVCAVLQSLATLDADM